MARIELNFIDTKGAIDAPITAPSAWSTNFSQEWGAGLNRGRKPVTAADAMRHFKSWVYICSTMNATSVASVPLRLYVRKTSKSQKFKTIETKPISKARRDWLFDGCPSLESYLKKAVEVEEVIEHPFLKLMEKPNPFIPAFIIKETTVLFADLTGDAYWYIAKNRMGVPKQIWVIPSQNITPIPGETSDEYIKSYKFQRGNVEVEIPYEDIIRFTFPNPLDQIQGFGVVRGMADAVYTYWKMDEFEEALFENKARPGGVLEATEMISRPEMERLKLDWRQKYSGAAKGGETVFLPPGVKFTRDSLTPVEISFIEGRKLTRETICAGFGQSIALFDPTAARANAREAESTHAKHGVLPRCRRQEQTINQFMLPMYGNKEGQIFVAYNNPVPKDQALELRKQSELVKSNIMLINEARAEQGLKPVPWGDVAWMDGRLMPVDSAEAPVPPQQDNQPEPPDPKKMATELEDAIMQSLRRKLQ